jgi:hypothetical protein
MTEKGRIWLTLGILVVIGIAILLIAQPWQRPTPQPPQVTQQPPPEQPTPPPTAQPPVEPPQPPLPTPPPRLSLSASWLSLGSIRVNSSASGSFMISNSGGGVLEGSISCSGNCSVFEFSPSSFRLASRETLQVQVTFQPSSATSYSATLNISSDGGSASVSLQGSGYQPPPLPSKIASVQHPIFVGDPEKPVLVVIEESHAGLAVQSNCTMAIEALLATSVSHVLLVEGTAPERVDLSSMFGAGEELYRMAAAEAWFELGWLTGVEIAALRHPSVPLYGVENPQGPERLAHLEARRAYEKAFDDVLGHVNKLYTLLVKGGRVPAPVEQALKKRDQAYDALVQPPAGALPLELLTETLGRGQAQGLPVHQTLKELQQRFSGAETTFSELRVRYEEAHEDLFIAIIEAAESQGLLDVSSARQSLEKLRQARSNKESAQGARDRLMITNATKILANLRASIGILVVGVGHTLQLTADLQRVGISYVVVTPNALEQEIAEREMEWFERHLSKEPSPIEKWLGKGYKPELYLATPQGRKTFATGVALLELLNRALHGEPVSVPAHTLIRTVTVTPLPEKVSLYIQGLSGNSLHLTFPTALELTKMTAKEVALHLLEALEAIDLLRPREDGFFTPAVHLYLEPDGRRGGAFVSYVSGSTLSTEIVPFDLPSPAVDMLKAYEDVVAAPPPGITREEIVQGQPQSLLRPVFILQPVIATLNRVLDELRIPKNQIVPVALRMARISGEAYLRDINFTELLGFVRKAGLSGFERRLMLVKSALEHDSELIKIGSPERPLSSTLKNVHAWGATAKHVAVFTIPTSEEEWTDNDFAQHLGEDKREWYKRTVLPVVEEAINAIGKENVLEPQNLNELLVGLKKVLADATDATVTLTFVGHKVAGREGLVLHFKGRGSEAPLNQVVQEIRLMQERGSIPKSAQLEFNVIVCSAEAEAAETFVKQLGARLVLASPHALGVIMNLKLLTLQARKLRQGIPGYQAHLEAMEELIQNILDGRLEPPSLEMPAPSAREENDEASAGRA